MSSNCSRRSRLLTLTGSGGCGKTRLALQVAADALDRYADGVWFVELAPLSDPERVSQSVAAVLGLKEEPGPPLVRTLTDHLKDRRLLLLLDNCEHLLDTCARLADAMLRQCPGVRILASSREALGIAGEQAYRVPSLSLPDPKEAPTPASVIPFEAVQLFRERARLARADFAITERNAAAVASICRRLDGIPLALELAAARVRSLSVEVIDGKLNERFRLLTGGSRTALPRQQTLRALIDWSYDLLNEPARCLLQRLSVFAGGLDARGCRATCARARASRRKKSSTCSSRLRTRASSPLTPSMAARATGYSRLCANIRATDCRREAAARRRGPGIAISSPHSPKKRSRN